MAADTGGMDPWIVQPRERARYEEQFKTLNPINGIITGNQAKGFFFQSQLPVDALGQIWALADIDSDGRLDINEFSIACKLINLKLRGFPIPATLPPALLALTTQPSLSSQVISPPVIPPQPVVPVQPMIPPQMPPPPVIPPQPQGFSIQPQQIVAPPMMAPVSAPIAAIPQMMAPQIPPSRPVQPVLPQQPLIASQPLVTQPTAMTSYPAVPPQPIIASEPLLGSMAQPATYAAEPVIPAIPRPSLTGLSSIPSGLVQSPPGSYTVPQGIVTQAPQPAAFPIIPPAPMQSSAVDATRSLDRRASVDSQSSVITSPVSDWSVPHASKLKYTQLFNTHDRMRSGFLSTVQARDILMSTRLSQKILATVWTLADTDNDGRLSCEELVLAMHLCDMAREGTPLPTTLPPDLIPPTMRRKRGSSFSLPDDRIDPAASLPNSNVTFEDKRKENFDKGQAELDRRRAVLQEAQRKEREERERKEREEEERREQLRLEQEARRQAELQEQLMKQRELEQQQEEQRRRAQEQKEAARKEAERQRQEEWERARTVELETQRMREQETVLRLKARNQNLAIDLSTLTTKVKELSAKITETRSGVSAVKNTIDGMRTTRDTHMSEMSGLKARLKEQNQRLLLLTQEKAKLEAKNKVNAAADAAATEQARVAFTNKQITIKHLTEKVEELKGLVESKTEDFENNNKQLSEARGQLKNLINSCDTLYETYADKRDAVLQLKAAATGGWGASTNSWETPAADSWGAPPTDSWGAAPSQDDWPVTDVAPTMAAVSGGPLRRFRALYEFSSRNPDELSLMPGDIVMVSPVQSAEPGWLMGELRGASGWFPESYAEPFEGLDSAVAAPVETTPLPEKQPLEGILEVPETVEAVKPIDVSSESYVAVYPYQSAEAGDLSFELGEQIVVIKKEGDWWTGTIGDRMGIFPSNYVQKAEPTQAVEPLPTIPAAPTPVQDQEDDVFLQANETMPLAKSPIPVPSGRVTPADFERTKPATPDFSSIPAAQTKMGKKGEIATVIAPYQASSSEQLSLGRGQLVCIRKKTTTGWWEGELQAKGKKKQVGWFPASYVKILASRRLSQTTPDFEAELNAQKVLALFPYKAQNDDELSFEKDDVIIVISRDDAAWWKGDLKGTVGLFPSNYVMPIDSQSPVFGSGDKLRQEAIRELVESERAYTKDMANVRQVFEKPLARSGLVTREQIGRIFLNWREILRGNHHLLKLLDERRLPNRTYDCVGDILCENLPKMKAYIRFCSCQLSAGALLQELTDTSSAFRELCRQCQRDPRTQGLPLSTFLIKPMQRITKYSLLISKILEHTSKDHPDHRLLEEALRRADELCSQVNEGIRERENAEWLEWLQSHIFLDGVEEPLVFNSLTKHLGPRKLLHHGQLFKMRSGRELFGFLLSDFLLLAQPQKPLNNGPIVLDKNSALLFKTYKKPLLVSEITVQRVPESNERSFVVNFSKGQCALTAPTQGEVSQWMKKVKVAQEKSAAFTPTHIVPEEMQGPAIGRLLVEVVEAKGITARCLMCEMKLGPQTMTTPPALPPFEWHHSVQFLIRDIARETVSLCLMVYNEFSPNDILERSSISLREIQQHNRSSGQVLREISVKQFSNAHILVKFHLVSFH